MSEIAHTKLSKKTIKTLDQLAVAKGSSRSAEIRRAVEAYLADYTGEPDINDIAKRLREVESRVNELSAKFGV